VKYGMLLLDKALDLSDLFMESYQQQICTLNASSVALKHLIVLTSGARLNISPHTVEQDLFFFAQQTIRAIHVIRVACVGSSSRCRNNDEPLFELVRSLSGSNGRPDIKICN
jgi:hypothetical protein